MSRVSITIDNDVGDQVPGASKGCPSERVAFPLPSATSASVGGVVDSPQTSLGGGHAEHKSNTEAAQESRRMKPTRRHAALEVNGASLWEPMTPAAFRRLR